MTDMDSILFIYDTGTLKMLKEKMVDYCFFDIAWFLGKWDNISISLDKLFL